MKYADITSAKDRVRFPKGGTLDHDNLSFNVPTVYSCDLPSHIQSEMLDFQLRLHDVIQLRTRRSIWYDNQSATIRISRYRKWILREEAALQRLVQV